VTAIEEHAGEAYVELHPADGGGSASRTAAG